LTLTEQEAVEVAAALARYANVKADLDEQAAAGLTALWPGSQPGGPLGRDRG